MQKLKKKIWKVVISLSMVVLLTACGSTAANTAGSKSEQDSTTKSTQETKLSGKVVVYAPSPAKLADNIAQDFKKKTGVEVEVFQGTTGEILARLEAEKQNPVADVVIMASWADGLNMIQSDQVQSYEPKNSQNIYWKDKENRIFGYSASAVGVIYNKTIFPSLSASWEELGSNPAYKNQIAIPDPSKSGSCKDFLSGFVSVKKEKGQEIIDSWVKNGLTIPGANKAALESVTTGEKGILIAGVDYNAYSSIKKGEPLDIYYPAEGTVINPRPAMILKTSKNVDNAKAFMDYLLTDEVQKMVCDEYLLPGIKGITTDKRTNVSDVPAIDPDWKWMGEHSEEISNKLLNGVH